MKINLKSQLSFLTPIALIVISSFFIAVAQSFFKIASTPSIPALLKNTSFYFGIFCYFPAFSTSTFAYKYGNLSVLYPLTSMSIAINLLFANILFAEPISLRQIIGTIVIVIGVLFTAKEL